MCVMIGKAEFLEVSEAYLVSLPQISSNLLIAPFRYSEALTYNLILRDGLTYRK